MDPHKIGNGKRPRLQDRPHVGTAFGNEANTKSSLPVAKWYNSHNQLHSHNS
jgi:hypothetical protein